MENITQDVIVIGAGPAGLTAAIYTARERFRTLLLEKATCGGLAASTGLIENYPGFPQAIKGMELMGRFKQQAAHFGAEILESEEVKGIKKEGETIRVETETKEYRAYAAIVASGSVPKKLNVPGEEAFFGRGVSYCATCDGPLFKDKDVAVIGCGNSGLQEGEALLQHAKSVTFIEFLPYLTAAKILQERLKENKRAAFLLNYALTSINGESSVDSVTVKERGSAQERILKVSGVFIYAGFLPNTGFLKGLVKLDKFGYIKTDENMQTNVKGIYAAGDVREKTVRQIDTACAEGTIAAVSLRDYLKEIRAS